MSTFINKVAESGIISINLEDFLPKEEFNSFDIQPFLFMGLILKEKDFRLALSQINWNDYNNKHVSIFCSTDAIIPMWAYMLIASLLQIHAISVFYGTKEEHQEQKLLENIQLLDVSEFKDQRVVIKGCGDKILPPSAFVSITFILRPVVKSLMYGEPCSTVPIYKQKQN